MATSAQARRLTETHRLAQARIGAATVRRMLDAWAILQAENLDRALPRWLRVAMAVIGQQWNASMQLSASYVTAFRTLEVGLGSFTPNLAKPIPAKALITSLTVTGPVAVKIAMARGERLERAMEIGETLSAGAAMRWALDGGRETLFASIRADSKAQGWARATSGNPCAFCAMLASRGAVYREEDTAGFQAHDSCACEPEPLYSRDADLPPGSEEFRDLWDQSDGTLKDFRRAYEDANA